ncbi:hypothetical protein LTR27_003338 [Elasticomyces elasticus]|nr:hypothetical protein LTR27_003338 [Elasticomyces elasticus]
MSASFRSHFRTTPLNRDHAGEVQRKQSVRLPTAASNTVESKSKPIQHVSKLAKRQSIAPSAAAAADKIEGGTSKDGAARAPTVVAPAQHAVPAARRSSVAPPSDGGLSGYRAASVHRHDLPPPPNIRTPSLVSGSSASTHDSPRSTFLRKKSSIHYAARTETKEKERLTMASRNEQREDAFDGSMLGISMPPTTAQGGLDLSSSHAWHATRNITPPVVPAYAQSSTPSTRYTDSPFSHVPTPSSASSYSPAMFATSSSTARTTPQSPERTKSVVSGRASTKPDGSRLGLPSVRESSTSSSNSTVKPPATSKMLTRKEVPRTTASAPPSSKPTATPRQVSARQPNTISVTSTISRSVQIPPELAHLNVDPPLMASSLQKPLPPIRPSRDGTPNLSEMNQQNRIVQSDLPRLYTTYHKRTPSQETPVSAPTPGFRQRFGLSPKNSSRQPSPRVDSAISPPPSARTFARGPTPELSQTDSRRLKRTDSPAVGPAPSPSKSPRFGIFSRRPKVDSEKPIEKPKREPRKGPVAGTGHEGYGRFGFRGRSSSTTSSTDFRSPSTDSNASSVPRPAASRKGSFRSSKEESEFDDFIRERQRPVILRGSGSTFSNAVSTPDMQPVTHFESSTSSSIGSLPKLQLLPSAMRGDHAPSPVKRPSTGGRRLSTDSSEDEVADMYQTLATRRSLNRLSQAVAKSPVRTPEPLIIAGPWKQQSIEEYVDKAAPLQPNSSIRLTGKSATTEEGPQRAQPAIEPKPSRKWNFFQRAQASPRPKGKQRAAENSSNVPPRQATTNGVAHYAVLDAVEPVDLHEVQQILRDNESSTGSSVYEAPQPSKIVPYERRHSGLLPSPPRASFVNRAAAAARPTETVLRQDSQESPELLRASTTVPHPMPHMVDIMAASVPADRDVELLGHNPIVGPIVSTPVMLSAPFGTPDVSNENSPRQPRLSPVGRIPQVVSRRDRDRKLPDNSFSRPFARAQPHPSVRPPGALYHQIRELASPIESGSQPVSSTSGKSEGMPSELKSSVNTNPASISTNRTSFDLRTSNDFIAFTPRKGSEVSYSSSSGYGSWMAAVAPPPLQLEDPWNEYNDLLDDMLPQKTPISAGSSLGAPFQYASALYGSSRSAVPTPLYYSQPPSLDLPQPPRAQTVPPSVLSVPQQIARFMQPSMSPLTTPHTLSELYDDYGNRSSISKGSQQARNSSSGSQPNNHGAHNARASLASSRGSRISTHSRSASLPEANLPNSRSSLTPSARFKRDTQLLDIAEDESDGQAANANLRFGALMTSKWLSCGSVLFSPAHNEMRLANDPKVLVLDGLGSDWSYYVALAYPAATVYNLGPAAKNGSTSWPGINQTPPPNHKHYPLGSIASAFPFPKGFFTAVLFRFPIVTTDEAYQACINECKRVLRPGGYLEVAVLDLDLVNMGGRARSLVRGLKTRMQQHDPNISLRCLSDTLVRQIGCHGFEQVQRCIVGVPAAGRIRRSQDISNDTSDDSESRRSIDNRSNTSEKEYSFEDLLENAPRDRSSDEGITKMAAKVGRWWYSTCYETPLLATDKSIWADQALLRECEKQGTSFRLLICHAQKPAQTKRRTVSV